MKRALAIYIIVTVLNFGALNAHSWKYFNCYDREFAAFSAFYAAIPVIGTLLAVVTTGFVQYGFSWKLPPVGACR